MIKLFIPMPKCCTECPFCHDGTWCRVKNICFGVEDEWIFLQRPNWCPLVDDVPVKPVYREGGIFCGNCNSYIRTCDTFCSSCGEQINWAENRRTGEGKNNTEKE